MQTWRRLNIYTPTEIYKYRPAADGEGEYGWAAYREDADPTWPLDWPVGVVPIVPFRNDDDGGNWGRSEIDDLIPVQNALNKAVIDLMEGIFHKWRNESRIIFICGEKKAKKWLHVGA